MPVESTRGAELTRYVYDLILAGRRDVLEQLLAEDFTYAGTVETTDRKGWLDLMLDRTTWEKIEVTVVTTVLAERGALISAALVRPSGVRDGDPMSGVWHVIDVWQQLGVDWRMLSRTAFPARQS